MLGNGFNCTCYFARWLADGLNRPYCEARWLADGLNRPYCEARWLADGLNRPYCEARWLADGLNRPYCEARWLADGLNRPYCEAHWLADGLNRPYCEARWLADGLNRPYCEATTKKCENILRMWATSIHVGKAINDKIIHGHDLITLGKPRVGQNSQCADSLIRMIPNNCNSYAYMSDQSSQQINAKNHVEMIRTITNLAEENRAYLEYFGRKGTALLKSPVLTVSADRVFLGSH